MWATLVIFIGVFAVLQAGWSQARDSWLERAVIHKATVVPATAAINLLSPQANASPDGARIRADGGGLNILNGCEGTEVVFLLIAAFAAVRLSLRDRLIGLALGTALVFVLNQGRILALFYAFRTQREWFDLLHTTILPVVLVAIVGMYFYAFLHLRQRLA